MRSYASILKPRGKGKFMQFIPLINLYSGNRICSPVHPTPLAQGWTLNWHRSYTGQNKICNNLLALQLFSCWASDFLYGKDYVLLILPKKTISSFILERGHIAVVHRRVQMPGLGCLCPREEQEFTKPWSAFLGLVDGVWSHRDICNLPHGLYRMLNSVSKDKHIFIQEFSWIMIKLDNFAIFAAPNSQTQLYK